MNKDEIISKAFTVFGNAERPEHFTNHTHCCECQEHDEVLRAAAPETIDRESLGSMGWDPITFTTDEGFKYYLPGLIRTVLCAHDENSYYEQFLWHVGDAVQAGYRKLVLSPEEREVIVNTLNYLLDYRAGEIQQECLEQNLLDALELWQATGGAAGQERS